MAKQKTAAAPKEMETLNKKAVSAEPEPPRSEGFPAGKDEQPGVERIAFKIVDGKLDTASLRPSTAGRAKEVVQKSLSDSEFRKYFGLEHKPETFPQLISPVLVGGALNVVAYFETGALVKKTGLSRDEVRQFTEWTAEEHAQLDRQGADLCNKYIPPEYLKYADITLFFGTMLVLIDAKSKMVERYAKKRIEAIGRAPSHDTLNHSVRVDRRGLRGVRLPLFLCGGSERLDHCGGRFNGLCWTILALGQVHQRPETGQLKTDARASSAAP